MIQALVDRTQYVRRRSNEKFMDECIAPTIKHPPSVMVWSCISNKGPGDMYFVEGTMNAEQYLRVLKTRLLPQIRKWFHRDPNVIFMHDGAPCHKAKVITAFLEAKKIAVLDWPGNSPDLNPIENIWALLKDEASKFNPTTKEQLITVLKQVWNECPTIKTAIKSHISSMCHRIQAVLEAKGGSTKY